MRRRQREPSADPRDALTAVQAEQIAALEALVAYLRDHPAHTHPVSYVARQTT